VLLSASRLLSASGGDHYRDLPTAVLPAAFSVHSLLVAVLPSVLRIRRLGRLQIRLISASSSSSRIAFCHAAGVVLQKPEVSPHV